MLLCCAVTSVHIKYYDTWCVERVDLRITAALNDIIPFMDKAVELCNFIKFYTWLKRLWASKFDTVLKERLLIT